jgi:hypothetical protein
MKQSASIAKTSATLGLLGLALLLVGCTADGTTYGHTTGAPANGVFVIQNTPASGTTTAASGSILEFSASASGASSPVATIANLNVTSLGFLAIDGTGNVYTAATEGTAGTSLVEFPVGSQNNAQPTRSIPFNSTTELTNLSSLSADTAGDLYASNGAGDVYIFTSTTNGSVAPTGTVTLTSAAGPQATAVDTSGNLYVATATPLNNIAIAPIEVFAPATSATSPTRSISGPLTLLDIATPKALATDTAGNLYVANVVSGVTSILIFEPTASGNTPPMRDITGSNTQLGCAGGIAVDTEGGYIYVASTPTCGGTATPTILKFSTTGDGNIAPISSFTSSAWTNPDPTLSIAVY